MAERPPLFVGQSRSRDAGEGRLAGGIKVPASDTEAKLPHSPTAKPERTGSGGTACLNFGQRSGRSPEADVEEAAIKLRKISLLEIHAKDEGLDKLYEHVDSDHVSSSDESDHGDDHEGQKPAYVASPARELSHGSITAPTCDAQSTHSVARISSARSAASDSTSASEREPSEREDPLAQYPFRRRQTILETVQDGADEDDDTDRTPHNTPQYCDDEAEMNPSSMTASLSEAPEHWTGPERSVSISSGLSVGSRDGVTREVGVIEIDSTGADEDQCETCCNASQVVITAPASDSERGSPAFPISGFGATSPTLRSLGSSRSGSPRMKKESSQSPTWHSVHARHEAQVEALPRANLSREGSCPTIVPWGDPSPTLLKKFDSSSSLLPLHRIDSGASFFLAPDDSTVVGPSSSTRFKRESIIATQPFTHQAGGARELRVVKGSLVAKPCCKREAWFYRNGGPLKKFAPRFHGIKRSDKGVPSVLLEDLTSGYRRPCVLDVKMGVCTAAPDRTAVKQARCKVKDKKTTTGSVGARICGMRVYQVESGEFRMWDKHWGNRLLFDEFSGGICHFFDNGSRIRIRLAERFVDCLQGIRKMMAEQGMYRFYASSILFIYEGDEGLDSEISDAECKINVKMIDFAHVFPIGEGHGSRDDSYRMGLDNLLRVLDGIGKGHPIGDIKASLLDHTLDESLHVHCLCAADPVKPDWNFMSGSRSGVETPNQGTKTPAVADGVSSPNIQTPNPSPVYASSPAHDD